MSLLNAIKTNQDILIIQELHLHISYSSCFVEYLLNLIACCLPHHQSSVYNDSCNNVSHVSPVSPPCCDMLGVVNGQMLANNVAMRCVEMLQSFGLGFTVFSLISLCFNFRAKMANKILPIMADHQNLKVTAFYFTCMVEGLLLNHRNHMRYDVMQFEQSVMNTIL